MGATSKPIPALYTVYILRSTVRHASLYIGSTPNPPRRLKQHNGSAKGGAARTSRNSLRPWEMVAIVSGFPSSVGALKFEWALTNPHLSLHIPSSSRIAVSSGHKRNGMPRRPRASLVSILSNLHLLLRVPSFIRWPLRLHFFDRDVHKAWEKWCATTKEPLRKHLPVLTDFETGALERAGSPEVAAEAPDEDVAAEEASSLPLHGIHALPLDYSPMKECVAKGKEIFDFEKQGDCVVCHRPMAAGEGLYVLCTHQGCEAVGHLTCWSRRLLAGEDGDILPTQGHCPSCHGQVQWDEMMKELSLRTRGSKEVDKLLRKKRKRTLKAGT